MSLPTPVVAVRLGTGESGSVLAFDGRMLRLLSPRARAVGERVELEVGVPVVRVRGKVVRVFRVPSGVFELTLALTSLARADRSALEDRLGAGAGGAADSQHDVPPPAREPADR